MPEFQNNDINKTVDHLFRHEAGKMVAVLTRLFGFPNIEQAEDIVQDTMLRAMETWKFGKVPDNPQAWLYFTAKNKAIDLIRRQQVKYKIDNDLSYLLKSEYTLSPAVQELFTEDEIKDSQLRMMFACCHPSLSKEAQITLMLNTLCGLSVHEIADAFLTKDDTIQKRLFRTKEKLRNDNIALDYPGTNILPSRVEAVLKSVYLLFNEGYHSSHPQKLIREDLCEEAMRLTIMLTENQKTNLPQTNALLALMCFHVSRFSARMDDQGLIILLKDQDRNQWNRFLIQKGNEYLSCSASGETMHAFHIEAAIASTHANAKSYAETDWQLILDLYNILLHISFNPIAALNRCLVIGEIEGPSAAILELQKMDQMEDYCYYNTSLGEMHLKIGNKEIAKSFFVKALAQTPSIAEKNLLDKKIGMCEP
ncbi:MAG: sigma-70 family RNA polymerase sigma factor [Bacteroidetes bacterium]|nr:sigma-70 family RNA polymerase sigma factor [Bacteroidota bacterium]